MNTSWKKKNNPALLFSSWGFRRRTCLTSLLRIYLSHSGEFFHLMLGCRLVSFSVNICAISDFKWKGGLVPEIKFTGRKSVHLSRLLEKSTLSSDYSCNAFRKLWSVNLCDLYNWMKCIYYTIIMRHTALQPLPHLHLFEHRCFVYQSTDIQLDTPTPHNL